MERRRLKERAAPSRFRTFAILTSVLVSATALPYADARRRRALLMSISLSQVVPWGRSRREYELMFALTPADLRGRILDCGGGPASFCAELNAAGGRAVAVDPIYAFTAEQIRGRFDEAAATILSQMRQAPDAWTWGFHRDIDDLHANRRRALENFLADYETGRRNDRYVAGSLPTLPFRDGEFDLALSSHLLFLYSEVLGEAFHLQAATELARVAKEIRIFPLLNLDRKRSALIEPVMRAMEERGWSGEIVKVDYELQRGGNEMLRLRSATSKQAEGGS
jgi:SAM-dependent methyltransferase